MEASPILECTDISKFYRSGTQDIAVLEGVSLSLNSGESCAVLGPSGSGKTTLLTLAAGLDQPSRGKIMLRGRDLSSLSEDGLAELRSESVGFAFQNYQLMPSLTALENVQLPLEIRGERDDGFATKLLEQVGLSGRTHHYPSQLSGGEQQRVALARAFINRPAILFADEPTGSLDRENAERALEAMFNLNKEYKAAILLVTHDHELAERLDRKIFLKGGRLVG